MTTTEGNGRAVPETANIVIIGGGIIGLSVAYHLAKRGARDVILLERHELTSGTSWHAAGIVGPLRANINLTRLAIYATELFKTLEHETGQATGYRKTGGLWLAGSDDRLCELKRIAAMGDMTGLNVEVIAPEVARERMAHLNTDDLAGALWVAEDGQTNPVDTCMAYAKGARVGGVQIFENLAVTDVSVDNGQVTGVTIAGGQFIPCTTVVNCAGLWARQIGEMAGVGVPVQAVEHMYVVTEPVADLQQPCPIMRDLEGRIYIKEDTGKLVIGGFEADAKVWTPPCAGEEGAFVMFPEDWEQFEPFMEVALKRLPVLETLGIQHFMNGPESFTPDTRQFMGEATTVKNFFVAAGFNSIGIMSSAGVGRALADWIVDGEAPMDLWSTDFARSDPRWNCDGFLEARVQEAVANQFEMHWPYKQPKTGRNLRRSPLHDRFAEAGAVFGDTAQWERGLWFATKPQEREFNYSYGQQAWWPLAEREARHMADHAALLELSPFAKFSVAGGKAYDLLQYLCANDVSCEPGRLTYNQMLNSRGGIEADVTVRCEDADTFHVVSGAATRWKDFARIARFAASLGDVSVRDVTEDFAVLGLMGPTAAEILQAACDNAIPATAFSGSDHISVAGIEMLASRVSFVGEFGYELTIPTAVAPAVYDALWQAGKDFKLGHLGHFALDGCRMEKGYRHWGHDIGPDDTPFEAGLGFAVKLNKKVEFIGRDALLRQREAGLKRHLLLFEVAEGDPLLLHDEPIYMNGECAGITTSGARGPRTGKHLCLGYVSMPEPVERTWLFGQSFRVKVAGEFFDLKALVKPPYDCDGNRLKGVGVSGVGIS